MLDPAKVATLKGDRPTNARRYNLEAIPFRQNLAKSAKVAKRDLDLARRWNREGLLSAAGLAAVERVAVEP